MQSESSTFPSNHSNRQMFPKYWLPQNIFLRLYQILLETSSGNLAQSWRRNVFFHYLIIKHMSTNTAPQCCHLSRKRLCFSSNTHLTLEGYPVLVSLLCICLVASVHKRKSYSSLKYNCTHHSPLSPSCFPFVPLIFTTGYGPHIEWKRPCVWLRQWDTEPGSLLQQLTTGA